MLPPFLGDLSGWKIPKPRIAVPLSAVLVIAVIMALMKSTNDPVVSNQWIFYNSQEQQAIEWIDSFQKGKFVWVDISPHQYDIMLYRKGFDLDPIKLLFVGIYFRSIALPGDLEPDDFPGKTFRIGTAEYHDDESHL